MAWQDEFPEWERSLPLELTTDPVWRCAAYRLATFVADRCWEDLDRLNRDARTSDLASQLARALRSIGATYAEAYSRRSPKDRCRYYEYSLGSAREARDWTFKARHVIGAQRTAETLDVLGQIVRLLTRTVVNERRRTGQ